MKKEGGDSEERERMKMRLGKMGLELERSVGNEDNGDGGEDRGKVKEEWR